MSQLFTRKELKEIDLPPDLQKRVERYLDGSLCQKCMGRNKVYEIGYSHVKKLIDCPACGGVGHFEEE